MPHMVEIISAQSGRALDRFITLSQEYVNWMIEQIRQQYPELDIREFTSEHQYDDIRKKFPGEHVPPYGGLFIAQRGDEVCGCVALGKLTDSICELRTLYVPPAYRGKGMGRKLVEVALKKARKLDYSYARLDTLAFMDSALGLYRSLGFYDIEAYLDMSASLKQHICFLELKLSK
jgi:ribosomal protein S18 acetylase RimI-like enzyme